MSWVCRPVAKSLPGKILWRGVGSSNPRSAKTHSILFHVRSSDYKWVMRACRSSACTLHTERNLWTEIMVFWITGCQTDDDKSQWNDTNVSWFNVYRFQNEQQKHGSATWHALCLCVATYRNFVLWITARSNTQNRLADCNSFGRSHAAMKLCNYNRKFIIINDYHLQMPTYCAIANLRIFFFRLDARTNSI